MASYLCRIAAFPPKPVTNNSIAGKGYTDVALRTTKPEVEEFVLGNIWLLEIIFYSFRRI
jgi:hypothetical protein